MNDAAISVAATDAFPAGVRTITTAGDAGSHAGADEPHPRLD